MIKTGLSCGFSLERATWDSWEARLSLHLSWSPRPPLSFHSSPGRGETPSLGFMVHERISMNLCPERMRDQQVFRVGGVCGPSQKGRSNVSQSRPLQGELVLKFVK